MVNLNTVLNDRIARVARKEIRSQVGTTKKSSGQHRRDIAALKRQVVALTRRLAVLETISSKAVKQVPTAVPEGVRYSAKSVAAQRRRLGLLAELFGKLVGVSGLSIYGYESGKSRPRQAQLAKLVAVRGIGKREALKRLEMLGGSSAGAKLQRRRGGPTGEEFVTSLVKSKKATTSAKINAAWRKSGRPGKADQTLSKLVAVKKLKRTKLKGERGSRYSVR